MTKVHEPQLYPVIPGVTSRVLNSFWCKDARALNRLIDYLQDLGYDVRDARGNGRSERELIRAGEPLWNAKLRSHWARCNACLTYHSVKYAHTHGTTCRCGSVLYWWIVRGSFITFSFVGDESDTLARARVLNWSPRAGLLLLDPRVISADCNDLENIEVGEAYLQTYRDKWVSTNYGKRPAISLRYSDDNSDGRNAITIHAAQHDQVNYTEIWVVAGREYTSSDPQLPVPMHIKIYEDWNHAAPAAQPLVRSGARR
jgi:hypothetical protein